MCGGGKRCTVLGCVSSTVANSGTAGLPGPALKFRRRDGQRVCHMHIEVGDTVDPASGQRTRQCTSCSAYPTPLFAPILSRMLGRPTSLL
jgi:hypothetical protein